MLPALNATGGNKVVYFNVSHDYEQSSWNGNLPTVLLSFAVITPLSSSITMAFNRRERALEQLATYRSSAYQLYCGNASWDWSEAHKKPGRRGCEENEGDLAAVRGESGREQEQADEQGGGRSIDFLQHADTTLTHLVHLSDALHKYLSLPTASRARHRATKLGRREAAEVSTTGRQIFCSEIYGNMTMISQQSEALKYRGMPGNVSLQRFKRSVRCWGLKFNLERIGGVPNQTVGGAHVDGH